MQETYIKSAVMTALYKSGEYNNLNKQLYATIVIH